MADFNTEVKAIFDGANAFFATIGQDLVTVLGLVESEIPRIQEVLSVAASLTALVPGISGYVVAAESAVQFVMDLVKTIDGVLMPLTEAKTIGVHDTATPATDAEKRAFAVQMLGQSFPEVPTNTHDLHVSIAYAKLAKIQKAA